jgi:hypothetical protein
MIDALFNGGLHLSSQTWWTAVAWPVLWTLLKIVAVLLPLLGAGARRGAGRARSPSPSPPPTPTPTPAPPAWAADLDAYSYDGYLEDGTGFFASAESVTYAVEHARQERARKAAAAAGGAGNAGAK